MRLREEDLPMIADEVLNYVGEVWTQQDEKGFRTFLAYLTYYMYGKEHGRND